jgi:hypothetical protein
VVLSDYTAAASLQRDSRKAAFSIPHFAIISSVSSMWSVLFLVPGIVLSRFLNGSSPEVFLYLNAGWLIFTLLVSSLVLGLSWLFIPEQA